jgi:predicted nuclease of predicted toxin-antitoxin system
MAALAAYLDECVDPRLARKLGQRGFRVTTALAEGTLGLGDDMQLAYALEHDRLIVSHDQPDFCRWHAVFQRQGRPYAGIVLLPFGPSAQVEIRVAMLLDWVGLETEHRSRLFRWHDLQGWLARGNRLAGYDQADLDVALGRSMR